MNSTGRDESVAGGSVATGTRAPSGVTVVSAGMLSPTPWLAASLMANVARYVADHLLRAGRSATFVRKGMTARGLGAAAIFLLLLPTATSVTAGLVLMVATVVFLLLGSGERQID